MKEAASPWLRQVIEAALDTGLRAGALRGLRFSMVDLDRGALVVPRALLKNKHSADDHVVPMGGQRRQ